MKNKILLTKIENDSDLLEFQQMADTLSFEYYDFRLQKLATKIKYQQASKIKLKFVES